MKRSFLEYYKVVLKKVSFDRKLFMKEYAKALNTIDQNEHQHFREWLDKNKLK